MNKRPYLLENLLSKVHNKQVPIIIIKKILYYIYGDYTMYMKDTLPYLIWDAFKCYICSYDYYDFHNYFNYENCCSKECLFDKHHNTSEYYYDNEYDEEEYINNRRMDYLDDYNSD